MPTSEDADPPYYFDPRLTNPTFGTRYEGGPANWTWSDGVYTVNDEGSLYQPISDRLGHNYLIQHLQVVHTMVESEDPSLIGLAIEFE